MDLIKILEGKPKRFSILLSTYLIGIIGLIDYYIPAEIDISIFYLIPIGIVTWMIGKNSGFLASFISSCTCFIVNQEPGRNFLHPLVPYWNTLVNFCFFLLFVYLLSQIKVQLITLKKLTQTDALTGLKNRIFFQNIANNEINRARRFQEPLTLAYLDIDDFKTVNDQFGHIVGDNLLCIVGNTAINNLRKFDVFARLGGDEFAILLPKTGYEAAQAVLQRLQTMLLASMRTEGWSVTFSIGAITFINPPNSVNEMLDKVDNVMYGAKRNGKNLLLHELSIG